VLFTNSLIENDAQEDDYELGLARKICCLHMRKVSVLRMDQGLQQFPWKVGKV